MMTPYANLAGDSAIAFYETGADSITVQFNSGATYLYNYVSAGEENIGQMKKLAAAGRGLSTFISRVVRDGYAERVW